MKNTILFTATVLLVSLLSAPSAQAGKIKKVGKTKALITGDSGEFEKGDKVHFIDEMGDKMGKGTIYKVKGRKFYVKKTSGRFAKGMDVESVDGGWGDESGGSSDMMSKLFSGTESELIAVGGIVTGDFDSSFLIGGDYAFMRPKKGQDGFGYRGGFTYWSISETFFEVSYLEFSGAAEYIHNMNGIALSGGARFGYVMADFESVIPVAITDDDSMAIIPFIAGTMPIGDKMAAGAEIRSPYFLTDGEFFDIFYILGAFHYKF